jgi:hypothetical protein
VAAIRAIRVVPLCAIAADLSEESKPGPDIERTLSSRIVHVTQ